MYGVGDSFMRRCTLKNIGRIGLYTNGVGINVLVEDSTYVGKGYGDWLDYGIEQHGGAQLTVTNCMFTDCTSSTAWASAGIFTSTYWAPGLRPRSPGARYSVAITA